MGEHPKATLEEQDISTAQHSTASNCLETGKQRGDALAFDEGLGAALGCDVRIEQGRGSLTQG